MLSRPMMTRREAIKAVTLTAGAFTIAPSIHRGENAGANASGSVYPFKLPELGYSFDALEPYIDAQTMQIHHDKHNGAYVENLNKALAQAPEAIQKMSLEELLLNLDKIPDNIRTAVRNNAGGHYNHSIFWQLLKKNEGGKPTGELAKAIDKTFGSFSAFRDKLSDSAMKVFGSGWAWLVLDAGSLEITATPNQDSPISKPNQKEIPVVGIDVWEHAYYLKYQNRPPKYLKAFGNFIKGNYAGERYAAALKSA